jgi:hypothetical protein
MRFSRQRRLGFGLVLILSLATIWAHQQYRGEVPRIDYLTGWVLLAVILLLTLYNARKRVPFLPALSSQSWLQFHIYAGLLTGVLFVVHVGYRIPTGWFQGVLAWIYLLVMASGFFGLFISRKIPKRLTTFGGEVLFERIGSIRTQLKEQAQKLALQSVGQSKSGTIADFYLRELNWFFDGVKNLPEHLMEVHSPVNRLLTRISEVNRYLNQEERATMEEITRLVRQKNGLDYHYAHQLLLKTWLFVHIPLTYALLLFTLAHVIIVFAYSGGAR